MSRHLRARFALLGLTVLAAPLAAQRPSPEPALLRRAEVRVYTRHSLFAGRLVDLSATAFIVSGRARTDTVMRSEVMEVQVREASGWTTLTSAQLPTSWAPPTGPAGSDGRLVEPGAVVRVGRGRTRITGTVVEWRGDTLVLAGSDSTPQTILVGPDTRIGISAGRHAERLGGFLFGFVLGGAGGAAGASAACDGLSHIGFGGNGPGCGGAAAAGAVLGGMVLGAAGAAVGSAIKSERWVEVSPESLRSYLESLRRVR